MKNKKNTKKRPDKHWRKGRGKRSSESEKDVDHVQIVKPMDTLSPGFSANKVIDGYSSDAELNTRKMVAKQNRKKKKSGGFQAMGLSMGVLKGIFRKGYKVPTPIQRKCVPIIMDRKDVVAMARTGSGKTAAFLIPMFEKLQRHSAKTGARALILSPTRELAVQTLKFTRELGKFLGLRSAVILGGDKMDDQFAALHENPDIIIATPGRLLHVLVEMDLKLNSLEYVVFDEADRLFEMGFAEQLEEIIQRLPDDRQTLLFSATLPKLLVEFARAGLNDPMLIRLDVESKLSDQLKLAFFSTRADDKISLLLHLLRNVIKPSEQTVIFLATMHHVDYIKEILTQAGINCCHIYSSLDPAARKINVAKFTHKKAMVMLVTDVAARGIDIPLLDNVINFNFPAKPKLFVHRVGRVARAGRTGTAYSLIASDELPYLLDLHLFLGRPLKCASPSHSRDADYLFGRVPQRVVDDEEATVLTLHEQSLDIDTMKHVCNNAYKQYVKSRPAPAPESVKRMKEIDVSRIAIHPIFGEYIDKDENNRVQMVDEIKKYKPHTTIFEVGVSTKSQPKYSVMKAKRRLHSNAIEKYKVKKKEEIENTAMLQNIKEKAVFSSTEMSTDKDLEAVFSTVVAPGLKRKRRIEAMERKTKKQKPVVSVRDDDYYIHYRSQDHHAERGLSIGDCSFDQQASRAMLDLTGDDADMMKKHKDNIKWDRKKKKFIRDAGDEQSKKKKIKTESGTYIHASYKSNIYKDWLEKSKMDEMDEEEEEEKEKKTRKHKGGKWKGPQGKNKGSFHQKGKSRKPNQSKGPGGKRKKVRSEMKSKDQILKNRKTDAKKNFLRKTREKKAMMRSRGRGKPR
ncbi:ATP-dependent RNA helicase DDX54-like [Saccoglossus kowalevskii]|uniref:RNA helicase n=1 Tax=Saccoglossus kowalevskii TaxID=10224 RepID=A0ABM0GXE3_SACKO|nr:PREDICTED: ATP-dependent RNA helicase DDX54-like [Saccoglossus kowalevskii]